MRAVIRRNGGPELKYMHALTRSVGHKDSSDWLSLFFIIQNHEVKLFNFVQNF